MDNWHNEVGFAVTVCDLRGKILSMNKRSKETFKKHGGLKLIGRCLLDCHPEPARSKLSAMLEKPCTNVYTIRKKGVKKLIYQTPWFKNGRPCGLVELSLELPDKLPHFVRK